MISQDLPLPVSCFSFTNLPDNKNALLYKVYRNSLDMNYLSPQYRGYRKDYLLKNLTELEDSYVICPKCEGIMREAVAFQSSITCKQCTEYREAEPFQKVRDSISNLQIRCPLQRDCDWKGILSQAEQHLDACEYLLIECPLMCKRVMMRSNVNSHTRTLCLMRIITCEYCQRTGPAKDLEEHHKKCDKYILQCPNECEEKLTRGEVAEHNETCPKLALACPFEGLVQCSENPINREDIPEHNKQEHVLHLNMLHQKVLCLEDRLDEMELKLKCQKTLDGCEWELKNIFSIDTVNRAGPEFYAYGYKLKMHAEIKRTRNISFVLIRLRGYNEKRLGAAIITECRVVLIDKDNPRKSKLNSCPFDFELGSGTISQLFGTTRVPKWENNPLFRFYFDINSSPMDRKFL